MPDHWMWWVVGYFTIGWLLTEGILWAERRARLPPTRSWAMVMVYLAWPVITIIAIYQRLRGRS